MLNFLKKNKLLIKIIVAIVVGIAIGTFMPQQIIVLFIEISNFLQKIINFLVPLIVIGFVVSGISSLGGSSGKLLILATVFSYFFMVVGALSAYLIVKNIFPIFILNQNLNLQSMFNASINLQNNTFPINIPPVMDIMTAIILSFIIGIGISKTKSNNLRIIFDEFHDIVDFVVQKIMIPIIPFYIVGVFCKISSTGKTFSILIQFSKLIGIIVLIHILMLLLQYTIAGLITKKNSFILLKNVVPAYMTSVATQSSVSAIPFSLRAAEVNGVSKKISNFIIPLCSTIHLTGSSISIISNTIAVMMINNREIVFKDIVLFAFMLGIVMVAAPGVPCGAIFAVAPILRSTLGFDPSMIELIVALHVAQDGFGTACNVTGDGAIAVIINYINNKYFSKS